MITEETLVSGGKDRLTRIPRVMANEMGSAQADNLWLRECGQRIVV